MRLLPLLALLAACAPSLRKMQVNLFPAAYSAAMSSTPGLGMTPFTEPPLGVKARYRWNATEGFFVTQDETTLEISTHGAEFVTFSGKVYWSYDPGIATGRGPSPVRISVITEDAKTGKPLGRADFNLEFDGSVFRAAH